MRKGQFALFLAVCLGASLLSASAQDKNKSDVKLQTNTQVSNKSFTPDEVVRQFTNKESELREVWKEYSYVQESRLQVLGPANTVSGEFYQVSEFVFNDAGKRIERIVRAPLSTLDQAGLRMTQEDKNAFINLQPFALSAEDLPNYNVNFVGKEKVDELSTYVFDVTPKVMSNTRELEKLRKQKIEGKYFLGRIWVDDQDLQIVKTQGKIVPEFEQRFPKFETYRENIDGQYWLPTYTYGDDTLEFDRFRVHVRMVIKYKNYRRFQSDVKLIGVDEVVDEPSQNKPATTPGKTGETKKEEQTKPKPQKP
jgi:hypothetical protein